MGQSSVYWAMVKPKIKEQATKVKKFRKVDGHQYYTAEIVVRDDEIKLNKKLKGNW